MKDEVGKEHGALGTGQDVEPNCIRLEKTCQGLKDLAESVKETG
jgi:hypothetical protein